MVSVRIQTTVLKAMVEHARAEFPCECCGLLMGKSGVINRLKRMQNILQSRVRFEMEPMELFQFFKNIRNSDEEHLGIYHSHPATEARPSNADVEESFYPSCAYFIVSLEIYESPQIRAFRIDKPDLEELEIVELG